LVGDDAARTFSVLSPNAGTVNGLLGGAFYRIKNLTGGKGNDFFAFANGGSLAGNIDGPGGNNTLLGDDAGRTFTIRAANAGAIPGLLGGTFSRVQNFLAGSGNDAFAFGNGGSLSGVVDGGAGYNSLSGDDTGRTFAVLSPNA